LTIFEWRRNSLAAQRTPVVIDMPPAPESLSAKGKAAELRSPLLFGGMLVVLMYAPLAFGANDVGLQFIHRLLTLALFITWVVNQVRRSALELSPNPLYIPTFSFLALVLCQLAFATSYRYATLTALLSLVPSGIFILIAGETLTRRRTLRTFASWMAGYGFVVAVFALIQDFSNTDKLYWVLKPRGISAAIYGPYANHNHFAGLMEMLLPLAVAMAFLESGSKRVLLSFASVIMAVSLVLSKSRGGLLGLAVSAAFALVLILRRSRNRRAAFGVIAIVLLAVGAVLALASEKTLQHLTETQDHYRLAIYRDCVRMWWDRPLLGFGWGTFSTVYPAYRSFYTDLLVNHAHNDYLELLVETGALGITLAGWFLFEVFRCAFRKLSQTGDVEGPVLTIGLLSGVVALLAHSALDFNLHIPANAALFFVLCSAIATPFKQRIRKVELAAWVDDGGPLEVN
jgi:O-antigen ligase